MVRRKTFYSLALFLVLAGTLVGAQPLKTLVYPDQVRLGEPFSVAVLIPKDSTATYTASLLRKDRELTTTVLLDYFEGSDGNTIRAGLLAVPNEGSPGPALLRLREGHPGAIQTGTSTLGTPEVETLDIPMIIVDRQFSSETIPLDRLNTELLTKPDPKKTAEATELWKILIQTNPHFLANTPFVQPVTSERRTSGFGDRRIYVYADGKRERSVHGGIDFAVPRGTQVHACADGVVSLAEFRIVTGNSVAIEHWPGLYSLYYHLDSINVKVGDRLRQGDIIGQSGSTGLSTGPHLHWEIRLHGQSTDPDIFTTQSVLDKDRIVGKIYEKVASPNGSATNSDR